MPSQIDHLVIAATDLGWLVDWWGDLSGVAVTPGGSHDGRGTANALVGLAGSAHSSTYLELIGPDPDQPDPPMPRAFGIDTLEPGTAHLVTFAVSVENLETAVASIASVGLDPGPILEMSRLRPDGVRIAWRLAVPDLAVHGGTQPFAIEWGDTQHPSSSLPPGASLESLTVQSPVADTLAAMFDVLGLEIGVVASEQPMLRATIKSPMGTLDIGEPSDSGDRSQ